MTFQDPTLSNFGPESSMVNAQSGHLMCFPLKERLFIDYPTLDHIQFDLALYRGSWNRNSGDD